jgi:hypothetical protein
MLSRYMFIGRRREVRRGEEQHGGYYIDQHSSVDMTAVVALLLLTVIDAVATLHIVGRGGQEMNPIMRGALDVGEDYFVFSKVGISLLGAFLILLHVRFPGVRRALRALLVLYSGVLVYHAFLIYRHML